MKRQYYIIFLVLIIFAAGNVEAQSTRSSVNKGVGLYQKGKYIDSEVEFKKGLSKSPNNFQANYDLGDSYYKEGKYKQALEAYSKALSKTKDKDLKAKIYHNMGNALLKSRQLKQSVGAYVNSLKLNPKDADTKYNLSYALDLMKHQNKKNQNKNQNKKNKNDKNKQNKQNNQNKNNQNKNNKNKNKQNQNQNNQNKNQQNKQQQNQPQQNQMSKQQADAILNALNNNEKDLQKKLRKIKGNPPAKNSKDW